MKATSSFCKAANMAAKKQGLKTFRQRAAAFQDATVRTKRGSEYNDFFGQIPLKNYDENGNRADSTRRQYDENGNYAAPPQRPYSTAIDDSSSSNFWQAPSPQAQAPQRQNRVNYGDGSSRPIGRQSNAASQFQAIYNQSQAQIARQQAGRALPSSTGGLGYSSSSASSFTISPIPARRRR